MSILSGHDSPLIAMFNSGFYRTKQETFTAYRLRGEALSVGFHYRPH